MDKPIAQMLRDWQLKRCRCGHPQQVHQHDRRGTDCALCACPRFRRRLARTVPVTETGVIAELRRRAERQWVLCVQASPLGDRHRGKAEGLEEAIELLEDEHRC